MGKLCSHLICKEQNTRSNYNRPFPSSPGPPFQNEVKCSAFGMEKIFQSHANKTHFHQKGWALGLILKVSVFVIRKSPIQVVIDWFFDYWATFKVQLFERRLARTRG